MYTKEEYNEIKDILKEQEQEDKIKQIENNTIYILQHQMKIISINIEDLRNKVKIIKEFLKKQKPDIMCLMETHTYYEDCSKIKGWLKNKDHKVFDTENLKKNIMIA